VGDNENGVRKYLQVRMPTFNLSPNEVQALVNYFMGASVQPQPYVQEPLEEVKPQEQMVARALFTSKQAPCLSCHMTGDRVGDLKKSAPNFLIARERLKPEWTRRWILDPKTIAPDTTMPSGLFADQRSPDGKHQRYVFNGRADELPPALNSYDKDHLDLVVRYLFQISGAEQSQLVGARPSAGAAPSGTAAAPSAANSPSRKPIGMVRKARLPSARGAGAAGRAP
jgi:hypothetical protein